MNTKVEEALGVLTDAASELHAESRRDAGNAMSDARHTLAAHIAQQDATIARAVNEVAQFREVAAENDRLRAALDDMTTLAEAWAGYYARNYMDDKTMDKAAWHPKHRAMIDAARAALNQEQGK